MSFRWTHHNCNTRMYDINCVLWLIATLRFALHIRCISCFLSFRFIFFVCFVVLFFCSICANDRFCRCVTCVLVYYDLKKSHSTQKAGLLGGHKTSFLKMKLINQVPYRYTICCEARWHKDLDESRYVSTVPVIY